VEFRYSGTQCLNIQIGCFRWFGMVCERNARKTELEFRIR